MIQFIIFCLLWQAVSASEYYCLKGEHNANLNVKEVEDFMNDPPPAERQYKIVAPLTIDILKNLCEKEDIVIVRRFKVEIESKKISRSLSYLAGAELDQFENGGGICHTKYEEGKDIKVIEYTGRGDMSSEEILQLCGYRELKCGESEFKFSRFAFDLWCRFSLKKRKWTSFFTAEPLVKMYEDDMFCELGEKGSVDDSVLCLRKDCSNDAEKGIDDVCTKKKAMRKRTYTYTRTGSQWGHEAFKHFFRNYIITFFFYCYFMLQARRNPMVRRELTTVWKKFKSAIEVKEDDESAMPHVQEAKKREKFLYERFKRELKVVKKVPVEHLHEELKEVKAEISRQAELVKEEEEGESASNRPPNMSTGTKLVQNKPCSLAELRSLIQWSWIMEAHMIRAMKEDDQPSLLRKSYGLDGKNAFAKII